MINEAQNYNSIVKIVASNPVDKSSAFRIVIKPISLHGEVHFQAEKFVDKRVLHENIPANELSQWLTDNVENAYKQVLVQTESLSVTYLYNKGNCKRLEKPSNSLVVVGANNRDKNYVINEGDCVPALVDLGVFTKDFKVVNGSFDKFKQVNRFVEIIDDVFKNCEQKSLTILDFGCGKSYLTFVLYHYFVNVKGIDVRIIGYDLKEDVVKHCNALAIKYGYDKLHFVVADVSRDKLADEQIDMVISLHACDTATDYALNYAISHKVKYIFSVPCCQHEVNLSAKFGNGDLDILMQYGLIKERTCALLTDAIRAQILQDCGYSVDVLEFVDFAHSPKNIMLRCKLCHRQTVANKQNIQNLLDKYNIKQTLFDLVYKEQ